MNIENYSNFLLQKLPVAKFASGKSEIVTRCRYCPDSKDKSKGHFYISIPRSDKEPSKFYCQKCGACGIVTSKKLIEWGIYDSSIAVELSSHNKNIYGSTYGNFLYKYNEVFNIKYTRIKDDKLSRYKLDYVNKRLGLNLTYQDCIEKKIVLNIQDIIQENNLSYTRHENIVKALDNGFVGFLSYDNAYLNMRNLDILDSIPHNLDKRYINYNLINLEDNTKRFYVIPSKIDLTNPNPININIAEGVFDILSVYYNTNTPKTNSIFGAIGGKKYLGLAKYFISQFKLINVIVHLYVDLDVERWIIDNAIDELSSMNIPVQIHKNIYPGEKDFGVPKNRIQEVII